MTLRTSRVVFDIGHPAHVHLFRHVIARLERDGHQVLVTATEKEIATQLLREFGIPHISLGKPGRGLAEKGARLALATLKLLRIAAKFRPDVLVGMAPVRAAPVAWALRRPCIGMDDTEHAALQRRLYLPFVTVVLTPACYAGDLGRKQVPHMVQVSTEEVVQTEHRMPLTDVLLTQMTAYETRATGNQDSHGLHLSIDSDQMLSICLIAPC